MIMRTIERAKGQLMARCLFINLNEVIYEDYRNYYNDDNKNTSKCS